MLQHIAIIMDGNGRWAKARHLPRAMGHKKGGEAAKNAIKYCIKNNIAYLTLYTFSSENWQRPKEEVDDLMNLFRLYMDSELDQMHENGIRLRFLGDRTPLSSDIIEKINHAEQLTVHNTRLNLNIALSYGSRQEITNAVKNIARQVEEGQILPEDVDENIVTKNLYTHDIPDPDMLIRTGGEHRISNYLLWQCAYTEFYFTDILWPEFNDQTFDAAIADFYNRERRFGRTTEEKAS